MRGACSFQLVHRAELPRASLCNGRWQLPRSRRQARLQRAIPSTTERRLCNGSCSRHRKNAKRGTQPRDRADWRHKFQYPSDSGNMVTSNELISTLTRCACKETTQATLLYDVTNARHNTGEVRSWATLKQSAAAHFDGAMSFSAIAWNLM